MLESTQNPKVKFLVRLRMDPKARKESGQVLVLGEKVIQDLVKSKAPDEIFYTSPPSFSCKAGWQVSEKVMKKISGLNTPPSVAALFPLPEFSKGIEKERVLVLDGVQDPGNVGTLLRSALAFGFTTLFLTQNTADPFGEKALSASRGAPFFLKLVKGEIEDLFADASKLNLPLYGADLKGSAPENQKGLPFGLILGNEGQGLSAKAKENSRPVSLPMKKECESLNVAVAGSILMYLMGGINGTR